MVRRTLPPHYKMKTRPDDLNEIALPAKLDPVAITTWASSAIETHRNRIDAATDPNHVKASLQNLMACFDDAFIANISNVLLWFSGKDILAGMAEWLNTKEFPNPGAFRASLRDWIIENPKRTIELLPEWNSLIAILRS